MFEQAFVYVMRSGKYYKIGWAVDPEKRMKEMQVGNPKKIRIIGRFPVSTHKKARKLEAAIHQKFKHQHHRGEWYRLKEKDLEFFEPGTNLDSSEFIMEMERKKNEV